MVNAMAAETKRSKNAKWLAIGFVSVFLAAPNAMLVRSIFGEIDSLTFIFLKFTVITIITLPFLIRFIIKERAIFRKNLKNLGFLAFFNVLSTSVFFVAVEQSSASYASIIALLSPILLVIFSARLVRDKISRRAVAGITLAAIGGICVVALPAILHGAAQMGVYPLATVLALINVVTFPLAIIYQRKSNEQGVPLTVSMGFVSLCATIALGAMVSWSRGDAAFAQIGDFSWSVWAVILYSGLVVSLLSRACAVLCYRHTDAAVKGGLSYLETLASISLPLLILNEKLPIEVTIGAILILGGVVLTESTGKHHWFKLGGRFHPHHAFHKGVIK
jgi:drug/metabolite transporter (DMT)-like permease